jgi:hypothetical protein
MNNNEIIIDLSMDGDMWCAVFRDFQNLQESPAGFGKTRKEAVIELINCAGESI